ncbi:MAG TPA: hypothetical protein PLG90_04640 [Ignavibacteria bacterium]|nr:hypothetical protein [Ignavibacteria bacterium]
MNIFYGIKHYFRISLKDGIWKIWLFPLLLSAILFSILFYYNVCVDLKDFVSIIIDTLSIFIGFTIAIIAILASDNKNFQELKKHYQKKSVRGVKINLHQTLLIDFIFNLILEILLLIFNLIVYLFLNVIKVELINTILIIAVFYFLIVILFYKLRNITHLYLVLYRDTELVKTSPIPEGFFKDVDKQPEPSGESPKDE